MSAVPPLDAVLSEPMIFLSAAQRQVVQRYQHLAALADRLPCWVPARTVADALGFDHSGIELALRLAGRPYVWATEFENVHSLWRYGEPNILADGKRYACSEDYYQAQKTVPYDDGAWCARREGVMEVAVQAKLAADPALRTLLLATAPHPLLSLKADRVWGVDPRKGGDNLLARLWERLREELLHRGGGGRGSDAPARVAATGDGPLATMANGLPATTADGPPVLVAPGDEDAHALLCARVLPHLPPLVQQQIATGLRDREVALARVVGRDAHVPAGHVLVHGAPLPLAELHALAAAGGLDTRLAARPLWREADGAAAAANAADEAGAAHGVLQREVGAVALALGSRAPPVAVRVRYRGREAAEVHVLPTLTGLQLNSKVIAELGLDGGFQHYYLKLNRAPFGARSRVAEHDGWCDGCVVELEDVGEGQAKAIGHT